MDIATKNVLENDGRTPTPDVRLGVDADVLSLSHLAQYTSGDTALELELLGLFKEQAVLQFENIEHSKTEADWVMAVHTLKGSARGIGAGQVAEISAELEKNKFSGDLSVKQELTSKLKYAVATCIVTIETLLKAG